VYYRVVKELARQKRWQDARATRPITTVRARRSLCIRCAGMDYSGPFESSGKKIFGDCMAAGLSAASRVRFRAPGHNIVTRINHFLRTRLPLLGATMEACR